MDIMLMCVFSSLMSCHAHGAQIVPTLNTPTGYGWVITAAALITFTEIDVVFGQRKVTDDLIRVIFLLTNRTHCNFLGHGEAADAQGVQAG